MEDYSAVIDMPEAPADVRAMALYNRALLYAATNDVPRAVDDLNAVLAMTDPLRKVKSAARQKLDRMHHRHNMYNASRPSVALST
jgi:hypothetical protein